MATLTATFDSQTLSRQATFSAVIPPAAAPLKTLYLLHGWNGSHSDWLHHTRVTELADKHEIAVILPSGENSFYVDHPGTSRYGAFIAEELVKETRRLFPLSNERADTWIAGLSMGGYGALRNGLDHPERFGKIAAFSSPVLTRSDDLFSERGPEQQLQAIIQSDTNADLPLHMDIFHLVEQAAAGELKPNIYLTCGTEDHLMEENRELHERLEHIGYAHAYEESSGGHDWDFWNDCLEKALKWLTNK